MLLHAVMDKYLLAFGKFRFVLATNEFHKNNPFLAVTAVLAYLFMNVTPVPQLLELRV